MQIFKIVITGGPCAGKSTALKWIKEHFEKKGFTVLTVHETSTELIRGGVAPWTCRTHAIYQKCLFQIQLAREDAILEAAATMPTKKILLVHDRGALDGKAYLTDDEYAQMIASLSYTEKELLARYDGVFYLMSAARLSGEIYTTANNAARTEDASEAAALDDRTGKIWSGHPHFVTVEGTPDFEEKMHRLLHAVEDLLDGEKGQERC